jgi:MFS family permease
MTFWWLWLAVLVTWIGRFVVPLMSVFLTQDIGLSAGTAGLVVAMYGAGGIVSTLLGGVLADRLGRKRTLLLSQVLTVLTVVVVPLTSDPVPIAVLLTLLGLVSGAAHPAITTLITDLVPAELRSRAFAYEYWAVNLGYAVGPALAGLIAAHGYPLLFWGEAAVVAVAAVLVRAFVADTHPGAPRPRRDGAAAGEVAGSTAAVLADRTFVLFTLLLLGYGLVYAQSTTTLPVVMAEQGFSPAQYGLLLTVNGLLLVALQLPTARLLARWPRSRVLVVSVLVTGIGFGLQTFATTWAWYAVAAVVWTLGEMGTFPVSQSVAADLTDPRMRGRYLGVYAFGFSAASALAPLLGGWVLDLWGPAVLWVSVLLLACTVALGHQLSAATRQAAIARRAAARTPLGAPGQSSASPSSPRS